MGEVKTAPGYSETMDLYAYLQEPQLIFLNQTMAIDIELTIKQG